MQFRFQLGAIVMGFLLLQLELLLIVLILSFGQIFDQEDIDMIFSIFSIAVGAIFFLGHFKTVILIMKNMDVLGSDLAENEDPYNLTKNGIFKGCLWRVLEEWNSIKEVWLFNFNLER